MFCSNCSSDTNTICAHFSLAWPSCGHARCTYSLPLHLFHLGRRNDGAHCSNFIAANRWRNSSWKWQIRYSLNISPVNCTFHICTCPTRRWKMSFQTGFVSHSIQKIDFAIYYFRRWCRQNSRCEWARWTLILTHAANVLAISFPFFIWRFSTTQTCTKW